MMLYFLSQYGQTAGIVGQNELVRNLVEKKILGLGKFDSNSNFLLSLGGHLGQM